MSLQRCMAETTSREFVEWQAYMEEALAHPTREEWYLAQVAMEVRRAHAQHPGKVKLTDGLLKLTTQKDTSPKTEEERERQLALSKARWMGLCGAKLTK